MQKKHICLLAFFSLHTWDAGASSVVVDGGFADGLQAWTPSGPMFGTGETAVFTDNMPQPATLFQTSALPGDILAVQVSFDFLNFLSPAVPLGTFPDVFFATLYLGNSPFGTSISGASFDRAVDLFDMDVNGTYNVAADAFFGPSPKGAGWSRFSLLQPAAPGFTGPGFATIAFEFFDLNGIAADSVVAVDNVEMFLIVPEPGTALMAMIAAASLPLRRRRTPSQM